jgi:phage/plasmid-associated DNA primase
MNIDEVSDLTKGGGARVGRVVKNLVGQDPLVINEKYRAVLKDQRSNAAVMMSSNQIPKLPNEGGGLSEKMITLPIRVSFDKRGAEVGLKDRLVREEMAGILAWAVEGALELAREKGQEERWPAPEGSGDVQRTYRAMSNPLGAFLESRFVQVEDGWVPGRLIRLEWGRFLRETHTKGVHIPKNQLLLRMEKEGGWQVERRKRRDGGTGEIVMGLCGLALKKAIEEDL